MTADDDEDHGDDAEDMKKNEEEIASIFRIRDSSFRPAHQQIIHFMENRCSDHTTEI